MPTVTTSQDMPATPAQIWALITDYTRYGEWNVTHTGFPDGTPEPTTGASYREDVRIMGMPGQITWTIAELDAPNRLKIDGAGPMGIKLAQTLQLTGTGESTTVAIENSIEGGPLGGPMGDAVAQSARKAAADSLEKLAALVS